MTNVEKLCVVLVTLSALVANAALILIHPTMGASSVEIKTKCVWPRDTAETRIYPKAESKAARDIRNRP